MKRILPLSTGMTMKYGDNHIRSTGIAMYLIRAPTSTRRARALTVRRCKHMILTALRCKHMTLLASLPPFLIQNPDNLKTSPPFLSHLCPFNIFKSRCIFMLYISFFNDIFNSFNSKSSCFSFPFRSIVFHYL